MLACSGSLPFLVALFTVDYFPKIKEWSLLITDFEIAICQIDSKLIMQKLTENELAGITKSLEIIRHYSRPDVGYI